MKLLMLFFWQQSSPLPNPIYVRARCVHPIRNKERCGNKFLKGWFPYHLKVQNPMFLPLPTLHPTLDLNQSSAKPLPLSIISLHHIDSFFLLLLDAPPNNRVGKCPYLKRNKSVHEASSSESKRHFHLLSNDRLNNSRFFTPKPPLSFGKQIWSHLIQQIFLSSIPPPHKKLRWILTKCWIMQREALKKKEEIKWKTWEYRVNESNSPTVGKVTTTPRR
jgi:hypothetical protein